MVFNPYFLRGLEEADMRQIRNRAEKAKIYREYKQAKEDAGETVDPYEMDNLRASMAGNDPFGASMIPAGAALQEMVDRANERAGVNRMKIGNEMNSQRETENKFVQSVLDDNFDKRPEDFAKIFTDTFGEADGPRMYDRYRDQIPNMLNEATANQYAKLRENPASKYLYAPEDIDRMFPAQARNGATRKVLESIMQDNQRSRASADLDAGNKAIQNMPEFIAQDPKAEQFWVGQVGATMSDGGKGFKQYYAPAAVGAVRSQQDAKLLQLAQKDALFLDASRSGDPESMFVAIKGLMQQAGMRPPESQDDPSYLRAKQSLDLVGRTDAIKTFNAREADLKAVVLEEAEAVSKAASKRIQAAQDANFNPEDYGDGEKIDERITAAINLIQLGENFFPSPSNIEDMIGFVKSEYDADKEKFDPNTVAGKWIAEGDAETKVEWIDRTVESRLGDTGLTKPGTNFGVRLEARGGQITNAINVAFAALNKPIKDQATYNTAVEKKNIIVSRLKDQIQTLRSAVNTINNDPAKRQNLVNYNYAEAMRTLQVLESSLKAIEDFQIVPPTLSGAAADFQQNPEKYRSMAAQMDGRAQPQTQTVITPTAYEGYMPVAYNQPTNSRTRMDTYLDAIADAESNGNPWARASTSTARGLFQFTQGTWDAMVGKYGQAYGISKEDIFNPNAQRIMATLLTQENAQQLMNQTGKMPDEGDLYLAHFLGPSRASLVIRQQGSQLLASSLFPDAARSNPSIFFKDGVPVTVEELYKTLSSKVKKRITKTYAELEV